MDMIDFNKHDIHIFINDMLQKYAGDIQSNLYFTFEEKESEINFHKANSSPESPSNLSPECYINYDW